jgi:alkylhydroperoxidase family enzyme
MPDDAPNIRAREALIIGKPPRIPPLKAGEYGKEALEMLAALRKAISSPQSQVVPEYIATAMRHSALFRRQVDLSLQLYAGALSPRQSELAVLRTGWLCRAPYMWGQHVATAKRLLALTSEEIERVTLGSAAVGWNEHDRAILRAVDELHADAMITDETWAALVRELNEQQLIELPILIGHYRGVAYLQNSLRVRLMPANPGLSAR